MFLVEDMADQKQELKAGHPPAGIHSELTTVQPASADYLSPHCSEGWGHARGVQTQARRHRSRCLRPKIRGRPPRTNVNIPRHFCFMCDLLFSLVVLQEPGSSASYHCWSTSQGIQQRKLSPALCLSTLLLCPTSLTVFHLKTSQTNIL